MITRLNFGGEDKGPPQKRDLTWVDSLVPTIIGTFASAGLLLLAAPLIGAALLSLFVNDPQSAKPMFFAMIGGVLGVVLLFAVSSRAWGKEYRNSYLVPPMIPLMAVFIFFLWSNFVTAASVD